MGHEPIIFNQLFNLIPRHGFEKFVKIHDADRYANTLHLEKRLPEATDVLQGTFFHSAPCIQEQREILAFFKVCAGIF